MPPSIGGRWNWLEVILQGGVAFRSARPMGALLVAVMTLALIISTALAHVVPLPSADGANHVAGITNPISGSSLGSVDSQSDAPAPGHHDHEHVEVDHDGTVPARAVDAVGTVADTPTVLSQISVAADESPDEGQVNHRDAEGPSLAALSISRT